jgi:hypothetical protein
MALEDMGREAKFINVAGWAVVDKVSRLVREERDLKNEEAYFVYFLCDNEIYNVENDGELTDATKQTGSSVYHINGKLVKIVDRDRFREVFNILVPLLRGAGKNPKLIILPLVWYISVPCCGNAGHVKIFGNAEFAVMLGEAMTGHKGLAERLLKF